MSDVDRLEQLRKDLRLKYRAELEQLPPAELVVPAEAVARKSSHLALELPDHLQREAAWQLIRNAIDDAIGAPAPEKAPRSRDDLSAFDETAL